MRAIITGDLQAEFENLHLCEKVFQQLYAFAKEKKAKDLFLLGDVKERYNPVDCRVLNFITEWIAKFKQAGVDVYILLGNHDRIGLGSVTESWLPAISKAGATYFVDSGMKHIDQRGAGSEARVYFLPYRSSAAEIKKGVEDCLLMRKTHGGKLNILFFHFGVKEANYSETVKSHDTISIDDLHPHEYDLVIGAHIHMQQKIKYDHCSYVGSLFPVDWGEANQEKGFYYLEA